ncbi:MAG: hypothetical protein HRU80_08980 [Ignavibacteriales bacterium]|nr:MAG: hypothetical protein HRU80_08980 [Ignavibacteriales bacterium]
MMKLNSFYAFLLAMLLIFTQQNLFAQQSLAYKTSPSYEKSAGWLDWSDREVRAAWLSAIIPGAGQTFLGHDYKGAGLTLGFYGSLLTAILAENNFHARQDRIKTLTNDYNGAGNYNLANYYWDQIQFEKGNRDNDVKRRDLFILVTAAVYIYNMVDILYLTEDKGGVGFTFAPDFKDVEGVNGVTSLYSGIALKINLP